jgi:Arc/MetJ-type ribon-helix-helix transcriptional regulator
MSKQRLSASVDAQLISAAEDAVTQGRVDSVSAWVNDALRLKLAHERRLEALASFVAVYEAEQGEITPEEMQSAVRRAQTRAVVVRATPARRHAVARKRRSGR